MAKKEFIGKIEFAKGLEGVIANETKIGYVNGAVGRLSYRGFTIEDLAEHSTFEETIHLLFHGSLPTKKELDDLKADLKKQRALPSTVLEMLRQLPKDAHPMSVLRSAVSLMGSLDPTEGEFSVENYLRIGKRLIAVMPTIVAAYHRIRNGLDPIDPDPELDHAENFLYMYFGARPEPKVARLVDVALILHADHGMNASTFTGLVTMSSQSDLYSTVTAAIGSLKGPLHGGANERALSMLEEIPSVEKVEDKIEQFQKEKRRFMGWGHRVYKAYDPRAKILDKMAEEVASGKIYSIAKKVESILLPKLGARGIFPNVDYYSGAVYAALGFEKHDFTPIFAISRVAGWTARQLEYIPENRIFRPRAVYTGIIEQRYVPMSQRGE